MLYEGLPDGARSKQDPGTRWWGEELELLAQLVEEVSVLTADQRRKEPRFIPRPWGDDGADKKPELTVSDTGATHATGHRAMLAAAQMRGAVRL